MFRSLAKENKVCVLTKHITTLRQPVRVFAAWMWSQDRVQLVPLRGFGWDHRVGKNVSIWLQVRLDPPGAYLIVLPAGSSPFHSASYLHLSPRYPRWSFAQAHSLLVWCILCPLLDPPGPLQLALCGLPSQPCIALSPYEPLRRQIPNYLAFHMCGLALLLTLHLPSF